MNFYKKGKKLILILLSISLLSVYFITASAEETGLKRIYGNSYIETSIEVAKELKSSSNTYIIATVDDYPDALAGTILASKYNAPILFVSKDDNQKNFDYLTNMNVNKDTKFYILGGTGAVSQLVEDTLKSVSNNVIRLGGSNRFETCKLINDVLKVKPKTPVIIATGYNYPDALSISAVGGQLQYPILLVNKDIIPESIVQQLKAINPSTVYIAGGTGVVSDQVEKQIKNLISTQIVRFAGQDRYDTSIKIAEYFKDKVGSDIYVTGKDFHDALVAVPLASTNKTSIILVDNGTYRKQVAVSKHKGFIIGDINKISTVIENLLGTNGTTPSEEEIVDVTVETAQEFVNAIGSNKRILLKPGVYNLSSINQINNGDNSVVWKTVYDGKELNIQGISNLTIEGIDSGKVEIKVTPRYANIMKFTNARNVTIKNIVAGHTPSSYKCDAGVLDFTGSTDILITGSELYGCGSMGVNLRNVKRLEVSNCKIDHCSLRAIQIYDSEDIKFTGSRIVDHEAYSNIIDITKSKDVTFENCEMANNNNFGWNFIEATDNSNVLINKCIIKNNSQTVNSKLKEDTVYFFNTTDYEGISDSKITIKNSEISGNKCDCLMDNKDNVTFENCTTNDNYWGKTAL